MAKDRFFSAIVDFEFNFTRYSRCFFCIAHLLKICGMNWQKDLEFVMVLCYINFKEKLAQLHKAIKLFLQYFTKLKKLWDKLQCLMSLP